MSQIPEQLVVCVVLLESWLPVMNEELVAVALEAAALCGDVRGIDRDQLWLSRLEPAACPACRKFAHAFH